MEWNVTQRRLSSPKWKMEAVNWIFLKSFVAFDRRGAVKKRRHQRPNFNWNPMKQSEKSTGRKSPSEATQTPCDCQSEPGSSRANSKQFSMFEYIFFFSFLRLILLKLEKYSLNIYESALKCNALERVGWSRKRIPVINWERLQSNFRAGALLPVGAGRWRRAFDMCWEY